MNLRQNIVKHAGNGHIMLGFRLQVSCLEGARKSRGGSGRTSLVDDLFDDSKQYGHVEIIL